MMGNCSELADIITELLLNSNYAVNEESHRNDGNMIDNNNDTKNNEHNERSHNNDGNVPNNDKYMNNNNNDYVSILRR